MRAVLVSVLTILLIACTAPLDDGDDIEDVKRQSFIEDLTTQNNALRDQNIRLQELLLEQQACQQQHNDSLETCLNRIEVWEARRWDVPSPADRLPIENIRVYEDRVVLNISGAMPVILADTNSMDPIADTDATILVIRPMSMRDIHIGDIVGYRCQNCDDRLVMHRVVGITQDNQGVRYTLKGDNNPEPDAEQVSFEQIETLVVGIIY